MWLAASILDSTGEMASFLTSSVRWVLVCSHCDPLVQLLASLPGRATVAAESVSMLPILSEAVFLGRSHSPSRTFLKRGLSSQPFPSLTPMNRQNQVLLLLCLFSCSCYYN